MFHNIVQLLKEIRTRCRESFYINRDQEHVRIPTTNKIYRSFCEMEFETIIWGRLFWPYEIPGNAVVVLCVQNNI